MMDEWIKAADGFLLIFAINDRESFTSLNERLKKINKNNKGNIPLILVGNKCDLEDKREVNKQEAENFAKKYGAKYYETSALTDQNGNVKVVFQQCANMVVKFFSSDGRQGKCFCSIV